MFHLTGICNDRIFPHLKDIGEEAFRQAQPSYQGFSL
jgi:hypothetical protein